MERLSILYWLLPAIASTGAGDNVVRGQVLDADGTPHANVAVIAVSTCSEATAHVSSGPRGQFVITGLPACDVQLIASAGAAMDEAIVRWKGRPVREVVLHPGCSGDDVLLTAPPRRVACPDWAVRR